VRIYGIEKGDYFIEVEYVTRRRRHLVKRHKLEIFEKHYGMDFRAFQYNICLN
jgi:hypothetical protein